MSKNYDNWERLVRAVLRKEHDRELALIDSTDPSSNSSASSSFRSTSSDLRSRVIPMDYSDLTLDHTVWKAMLPPRKQELLYRSASMRFFLEPRTGRNCFQLGATKLVFPTEGWAMDAHSESRFSEVAVGSFTMSGNLDMIGGISMQMLSPETVYAAYLVFNSAYKYETLFSAISVIKISHGEPFDGYSGGQERVIRCQRGENRGDGWREMQVGDFYVHEGDKGEKEVRICISSLGNDDLLVVEGMEFRPLKTPNSIRTIFQRARGRKRTGSRRKEALIVEDAELQREETPASWLFDGGR